MAGTIIVPGTQTGWNEQMWVLKFERATYQKQKFIPTIDDYGRPYATGNIRKKARVTGQALASTADGTGLVYSNMVDTPVTVSATGNYVAVGWSWNEEQVLRNNLDQETAGDLESSLAELSEQSALTSVQSLTNIMSQADVDASMVRRAVARLATNTNGYALPGDSGTPTIYGIFTTKQMPNLVAIPEVNSAEMRGDSENPYIKGVWVKGFGFMLMLSTVIANDANGDHNCVYIGEAFVIQWNKQNQVIRDGAELQKRIICANHFGTGVKHNTRALGVRTTASAL
jgi:hypothetical protein